MSVRSPARAALPPPTLLWGALTTVYLLWGSTYLGIRVTVETMPGLLSAGARFVLAGLVLGAVLSLRRGLGALRVPWRRLASAALVGVLLLLGGNAMVVLAERSVPSGLAALLVAAVPLWVVVLRRVLGDRPRLATVLGVLLGFGGLAVLALPGSSASGTSLAGVLTIVGAALSWATGSVLTSRLPMPADSFVGTAWEMLAGGVACLLVGAATGEVAGLDLGAISGRSWTALGYLVVFGSLAAFTAYVWLLHNAPISLVATYAYVNPVVAVILGALILGESITAPILVGGAVVVAAVVIVVSTETRRAPVPPETQTKEAQTEEAQAEEAQTGAAGPGPTPTPPARVSAGESPARP